MSIHACAGRPGRAALLAAMLVLAAGVLCPLDAQRQRGTAGYARRNTSAEIIARRIAAAEARERGRGTVRGGSWSGTEAGALEEDLRRMAGAAGWQGHLPESRIRRIAPLIAAEAARYQLPPALVMAIIHLESEFVPAARSHAGATGLMQVMPSWPQALGSRFGTDLTDEATNLRYGTWVLQKALRDSGGDPREALLRYNGCMGARRSPRCLTYPDRVRQRVEAHAGKTCRGSGWSSCVADPLRRAYGGS